MDNKNYPVSQPVLYLVSQIIIDNLRANMGAFEGFSSSYSPAVADELEEKLITARALPNETMRSWEHETIRLEMVEMLPATLKRWKQLKRYIAKAYADDESFIESNWNAAGWEHYEAAGDKNWPSVNSLMQTGNQYIAANSAKLLANNNMPAGFPALFSATAAAFETKTIAFGHAKQHSRSGTDVKVSKNGDLYADIIKVCLDGQFIFEGEFKEKEFSFSYVSELVQPAGAAEAYIQVLNAATKMPLKNVDVLIMGLDKSTVTNKYGESEFTNLQAKKWKLKFMADGMADLFVEHAFEAGVRARIKVQMQPLTVEMPEGAAVENPIMISEPEAVTVESK